MDDGTARGWYSVRPSGTDSTSLAFHRNRRMDRSPQGCPQTGSLRPAATIPGSWLWNRPSISAMLIGTNAIESRMRLLATSMKEQLSQGRWRKVSRPIIEPELSGGRRQGRYRPCAHQAGLRCAVEPASDFYRDDSVGRFARAALLAAHLQFARRDRSKTVAAGQLWHPRHRCLHLESHGPIFFARRRSCALPLASTREKSCPCSNANVGSPRDSAVADVGSGNQACLRKLFLDFGCRVIGVEPNREMRVMPAIRFLAAPS